MLWPGHARLAFTHPQGVQGAAYPREVPGGIGGQVSSVGGLEEGDRVVFSAPAGEGRAEVFLGCRRGQRPLALEAQLDRLSKRADVRLKQAAGVRGRPEGWPDAGIPA